MYIVRHYCDQMLILQLSVISILLSDLQHYILHNKLIKQLGKVKNKKNVDYILESFHWSTRDWPGIGVKNGMYALEYHGM